MTKKKRPSIDDYMTVPQAIAALPVSKPTVYYWIRLGQLPCEFIGETKVVLKKDVLALSK